MKRPQISVSVSEELNADLERIANTEPRFRGSKSHLAETVLSVFVKGYARFGLAVLFPEESGERSGLTRFDQLEEKVAALAVEVDKLRRFRSKR